MYFTKLLEPGDIRSLSENDLGEYRYFLVVHLGMFEDRFDDRTLARLAIRLSSLNGFLCLLYRRREFHDGGQSAVLSALLSLFRMSGTEYPFLGVVYLRKWGGETFLRCRSQMLGLKSEQNPDECSRQLGLELQSLVRSVRMGDVQGFLSSLTVGDILDVIQTLFTLTLPKPTSQ